MCFSSNVAGIMANKIEQSFYSVYSYSGIESIKHALKSTFSLNRKLYVFIKKKECIKLNLRKGTTIPFRSTQIHQSQSPLSTNPPIIKLPLYQSTNRRAPSPPIHQSKSSLSSNPSNHRAFLGNYLTVLLFHSRRWRSIVNTAAVGQGRCSLVISSRQPTAQQLRPRRESGE